MSKAEYEKLPFGIDCARPNGEVNWATVAAHSPRVAFAGIRAGVSWGYKDPNFETNWYQAGWKKIARTAYHVLYPGQPVKSQMESFVKWVGSDRGELPLTLDVELDHGLSPARVREAVYSAGRYLLEMTGERPMIYTRASFVDAHMTGTDVAPAWYEQYDWWLAHYGALNGLRYSAPTLPKGVPAERVVIHQFGNGESIGMQSKKTDYNVWLQGYDHFYTYAGLEENEPVPDVVPEETPVEEDGVYKRLLVMEDELNEVHESLDDLIRFVLNSDKG